MGSLGSLLGKSKREAAELFSFCPHWRRQRAVIEASGDAEVIADAEQRLDFVRNRALLGSCFEWYEREMAVLHEAPVPQPVRKPMVLPIEFVVPVVPSVENLLDGEWPVIQVAVNGNRVSALVDSGAGTTAIKHENTPWVEILAGLEPLTTWDILAQGGIQEVEVFRLSNLKLGSGVFNELLVTGPKEPLVLDPGLTVGMNVLLGYPAVCFHWSEAELHLGDSGPCAAGVSPGNARLTGKFSIMLEIPMEDGSKLDVLLDTGALGSPCSQRLIDSNGGKWTYTFGLHPTLMTECTRVTDFPPVVRGQFQALIGMATLRRFNAFGWELNPLRVYFVPKDTGR